MMHLTILLQLPQFQNTRLWQGTLWQPCDNVRITLWQPCHHLVTTLRQFQNTRLCQGCHKVALWQPCDNVRTTLSQPCDSFKIQVVPRLWQGCKKALWLPCAKVVTTLWQPCRFCMGSYNEHTGLTLCLCHAESIASLTCQMPIKPLHTIPTLHRKLWMEQKKATRSTTLIKALWKPTLIFAQAKRVDALWHKIRRPLESVSGEHHQGKGAGLTTCNFTFLFIH